MEGVVFPLRVEYSNVERSIPMQGGVFKCKMALAGRSIILIRGLYANKSIFPLASFPTPTEYSNERPNCRHYSNRDWVSIVLELLHCTSVREATIIELRAGVTSPRGSGEAGC